MGLTSNPDRDVTPEFLDRVRGWIADRGEVFVALRYLAAAGARDFAICTSESDFLTLVEGAPPGADIVVFRDRQLSIRGLVTPAFIIAAVSELLAEPEHLVITCARRAGTVLSASHCSCESRDELRSALQEMMGQDVALGAYPAIHLPDHDGMISASKGGIDGPR